MRLRNLQIITITHQNLSVEELKHFVIQPSESNPVHTTLSRLKDLFDIDEILYLNTCNRISFVVVRDQAIDEHWVQRFFSQINPSLPQEILDRLHKYVDTFTGLKAIKHLYQVASSVDSLVVGEREIFRQFREAYRYAVQYQLCGDYLRLVEQATVNTAKYIYTHTKIGERPVSVASLTFKKMLDSEVNPESKVLLIGAGETNRNVARFMKKQGFSDVTVFNRSLNNASNVAELLKAPAYHLSDLADYKSGFDCIIVCTASTKPIVDIEIYKGLLQGDESHKVIVDLSVPRNVDPLVIDQYDNTYIDIESIRSLADENMQFRKTEMQHALLIIDEKAEEFDTALQMRRLEKALKSVPSEIKSIKETAIEQVFKKEIDRLDDDSKSLVLKMLDYMEKKCIAAPIKVAKQTLG